MIGWIVAAVLAVILGIFLWLIWGFGKDLRDWWTKS